MSQFLPKFITIGLVLLCCAAEVARSLQTPSKALRSRVLNKPSRTLSKRALLSFEVPTLDQDPEAPTPFVKRDTCLDKGDEIEELLAKAQVLARNAAQKVNDPGSTELLAKLFSFGDQSPDANTIAGKLFNSAHLMPIHTCYLIRYHSTL